MIVVSQEAYVDLGRHLYCPFPFLLPVNQTLLTKPLYVLLGKKHAVIRYVL